VYKLKRKAANEVQEIFEIPQIEFGTINLTIRSSLTCRYWMLSRYCKLYIYQLNSNPEHLEPKSSSHAGSLKIL